jgi:hypothetical protein
MKAYPRRHSGWQLQNAGSECAACDRVATEAVRIENDYMRGNDEVVKVCARHGDISRRNIRQLCAHIWTKAGFVARKQGATA